MQAGAPAKSEDGFFIYVFIIIASKNMSAFIYFFYNNFIHLFNFFSLKPPDWTKPPVGRLSVDLNESRWVELVHARRRLAKSVNVSPDAQKA